MFHDAFAKFENSSLAEARALALITESSDKVVSKLFDDGAHEAGEVAGPAPVGDVVVGTDNATLDAVMSTVTSAADVHEVAKAYPHHVAFQVLFDSAQDDGERSFVDGLKRLSMENTPMPWTERGPSLRAAIAFTGVEPANDDAERRFASILSRATHLLTPAEGRGSSRRPRRGHAETFIGKVRLKLDELPHGTRIPRWLSSKRVSWPGLSMVLGLPLATLTRCIQARTEVQQRLDDGRLVLGETFRESFAWRKTLKPALDRLLAVIDGHSEGPDRRPIAIEGLGRGKVLLDPLLDAAGVRDERVREALKCNQKVRSRLARVTKIVGTRRAHEEIKADKSLLTFNELRVFGVRDAEEAFRERNPEKDEDAVIKAGVNECTFLNRVMRLNNWDGDADVCSTLLGNDAREAVAKGCGGNVRSDRTYLAAVDRWTAIARAAIAVKSEDMTFGDRLASGIRNKMLSVKAFAEQYELPYGTLLRWIRGYGMPTSHQLHFVYRIEKAFGVPKEQLVEMLGVVRGGRNNTQRKTVKLTDGRTVNLKRYLCYLPADAIDWTEKRLREAVEEADRRHYGAITVNTIRQREVARIARAAEPIDPSAPILKEWDDLETFKTTMTDGKRYLCSKWEWNSSLTVEKNKNHMKDFARWCARPVALGGLGLPWRQVSFILVLNPQVVMKYVFHRITRFSRLTLEGKELGPILGGTEHGFVGFIKSLVDLEYGWLTQSRKVVKAPEVIDVEFPLERMSALDKTFTLEMPENPEICRVMNAELVDMINNDWTGAMLHARRMIGSLSGKVARHYKMIRDPHKLVMPILEHSHPIAVVLRQVKDALERARPINVCPMQHAKDYRNAVAMLLLTTVVFRSDTMRNMEYRADGTGHLIRTATGYDVIVGADRFKNGFCTWLFGPSYRRRDYERALGDWQSLTKIIDYYLEVCRPILLKGRESDLLFPTGQSADKWSSKTFNTMITNWTRMWSVRNERHNTGMTGVLPWGPHCVRDIVATHIILHFPGEERWELASGILCTGVDLVKTRYAFVNSRRELAKVDPMYSEAFAIGFGNDDLAKVANAD